MISRQNLWWSSCVIVVLSWFFLAGESRAEEGVEVLQRGPIHEAFVETITNEPQKGMTVDRAPPSPVNEIPPDAKPEGVRVRWIPGYWLWDEDRKDFLWVSGVWRNAPPGRRWVPGYWSPIDDKFQWISGFWAAEESEAIEYLPEPPANLEVGPNRLAPSNDHFWAPGSWVWRGGRYAWRPGLWSRINSGWTWIPPYYQYTPRGVIYAGGYWDYPLARRGNLFAPVYFGRPLYLQRGYVYRPNSLIEIGLLTASLFIQPRHRHYYYGDFFGPSYFDRGFYPWYSYGQNYRGYDPLFPYYSWQHQRQRNEINWQRDLIKDYERRAKQFDTRTPQVAIKNKKDGNQTALAMTRPLQEAGVDAKLKNRTDGNRDTEKRLAQMSQLRDERRNFERSKDVDALSSKTKTNSPGKSENPKINSGRPDNRDSPKDKGNVQRWQVPSVQKSDSKSKQDFKPQKEPKPQGDRKPKLSTPQPSKSRIDQPRSNGNKNPGQKPPKQGGGSGKGKGGKK